MQLNQSLEQSRITDETEDAPPLKARLGQVFDGLVLSFVGGRMGPDRFVDQLGHELKTPLTSIRSLSEILRDNPDLPPKMREQYLKIILSESHRLESVVATLLDGLAQGDILARSGDLEELLGRITSAAEEARRKS